MANLNTLLPLPLPLASLAWLTGFRRVPDNCVVTVHRFGRFVRALGAGWRAVIWPFDDRDAAERTREQLASRGIPAERSVKYGSSGAAGYLQDGIGDYAMSFPKPAQDDPKWDDLACFLLGAHMRAHGFADGNGRAVRCLYACTLLQGGREFVAPTYDFENQLHGL